MDQQTPRDPFIGDPFAEEPFAPVAREVSVDLPEQVEAELSAARAAGPETGDTYDIGSALVEHIEIVDRRHDGTASLAEDIADGRADDLPDVRVEDPAAHDETVYSLIDAAPTRKQARAAKAAREQQAKEAEDRGGSRKAVPTSRRKPGPRWSRTKKITAGIALTSAVGAIAIGSFMGLASALPWIDLGGEGGASADQIDAPVAQVPVVDGSTRSPAEQVVKQVASMSPGDFRDWSVEDSSTLYSPGMDFGCDPKDGLAPVVAATRTWTLDDRVVTMSVGAYGAGGGAVAFEGILAAALDCDGETVGQARVSVGVEAASIDAARAGRLTWRRGDVLVAVTAEDGGAAAEPASFAAAWQSIDAALEEALAPVCTDPEAGAAASVRSPYVDPAAYAGLFTTEEIERVDSGKPTAEETSVAPVVDLPPKEPSLPDEGERPAPPNPLPTSGPTALPLPVEVPVAPAVPSEPNLVLEVQRAIPDPEGPGCGWEFTAQEQPEFDSTAATERFNKASTKAERVLERRWVKWQRAKSRFYSDWYDFRLDARAYRAYVTTLGEVRAAWAVIEAARTEYLTALADYQTAVAERDAFLAEREQAKTEYAAAKAECRNQPSTPDPTTDPTDEPSDPTAEPTSEPPSDEPVEPLVCPPPRPAILDEAEPTVGPRPVPAPEAQLPKNYEP